MTSGLEIEPKVTQKMQSKFLYEKAEPCKES